MKFWNQIAAVRLLLPFVSGILAAVYLNLTIPYYFFITLILFLLLFLFSQNKNPKFSYRFRWVSGCLASLILFVCGVQLIYLNTDLNAENHFSNFTIKKNYLLAQITEPLIDKGKSFKTEIKIKAVLDAGRWKTCSGKALLYLQNETASSELNYGDLVLIYAGFKAITPPQNPSEFNYKRYLQFQNIIYQTYIKTDSWKNLHINQGNLVLKKCLQLRAYLLNVFKENGIQGNEFAVGSALILGYEDKLNSTLMNAYSASGALHVLSVSGLHIAIVFVVLNYALLFVEKIKHGTLIKALILIVFLWLYAALTGLSPSVLRSAAMFTLLIIGKSLNRYTNIYNTLAASMFMLLLWNPYLLLDVGFQLSYLAVLGIISIHPKIYELWETKNKLLDQTWKVVSVSLAAQLITFPLALFYFHQFPNYFLLANLVVIPVSAMILYIGVAVCAVSQIKIVAMLLCKLLGWLIWFLNSAVTFFEELPHSVISGISISILEAWILYILIFSIFIFLSFQKIKFLKLGLLMVVILICVLMIKQQKQKFQTKLIVYKVKNQSAMDLVKGNTNYFFSDTSLSNNRSRMLFHIEHNWWNMGMDETIVKDRSRLHVGFQSSNLKSKNNFILFHNKKILCINQQNSSHIKSLIFKETIDYLIVSDNSKIRIDKLLERINFKKVIFDSSNSFYKVSNWKKQCVEMKIDYYDVNESGAFIAEL